MPQRLTLLGQALHPLCAALKTRLDGPVGPSAAAPDMAKFLSHHLEAMRSACYRLEDRMRGLMADVVSDEAASDADVHRSAARFEAVVDDLLDGHR